MARRRKIPLGRRKHTWMDNIMKDIGEIVLGCVDWINVAHDRDIWRALVNAVMNSWFP
jgi:hypothetical protein